MPAKARQLMDTKDGRLEGLLAEAAGNLQAASGGAAVCALTKSGRPVPGIKYHEGRWAALHEASRRFRHTPLDTATADEVLSTWSAALRRALEQGAGPDWIAYRQGGVDALTDLLADSPAVTGP